MAISSEDPTRIRRMFRRIHRRYDLLNRLISLGQDRRWRRKTIERLAPKPGALILDLGAGTGDLSAAAVEREPTARAVALDFTREMLVHGRRRHPGARIDWVVADASALPFMPQAFDGVITAFLLRNVADVRAVLAEGHRALRPLGRLVCLESNPSRARHNPLLRFHFDRLIPTLGALIARDRQAYEYLVRSMDSFLSSNELLARLREVGFEAIGGEPLTLGTVALHWGTSR